ncbi:MAG: DUF5817 domain-containing protein [Methanomethylophilus sp.]|jgi:hypothetical protein
MSKVTMFAIIKCGSCKRPRIIDDSDRNTVCPFCGNTDETKGRRIYFRSSDQKAVREELEKMTGGAHGAKPKEKPMGEEEKLLYEYQHTSGLDDKMDILAEGLTRIYGEWTVDDMRKFEPKNAEKMLSAMLDECLVFETKYGRYRKA